MSEDRLRWHYEEERSWLYNAFSFVIWVAAWIFAQGALVFLSGAHSLVICMAVWEVADSDYYPFFWGMFLSPWLWLGLVLALLGTVLYGSGGIIVLCGLCAFAWQLAGKFCAIMPIVVLLCGAASSVYIAWRFCGGGLAGVVSAALLSAFALACHACIIVLVWKLCTPSE